MKNYAGIDAFCDGNAVINNTKPRVRWRAEFEATGPRYSVSMDLHFNIGRSGSPIIQMGFKEGFTAGLENLDQYIAAQFYLRKQKKPHTSQGYLPSQFSREYRGRLHFYRISSLKLNLSRASEIW